MLEMIIVLWVIIAVLVAWGSFHFALRDPPSTSWMKIGFASSLLAITGTTPLWLRGNVEENFVALCAVYALWAMLVVGLPACAGTIVGALAGMYGKWRVSSQQGSAD